MQIDLTDFSETQSKQIVDLLLEYSSLFSQLNAQPGVAVGVEHLIDTVQAQPVNQPPYKVSPRDRALINQLSNEMLQEGVIQPSGSPWASPLS